MVYVKENKSKFRANLFLKTFCSAHNTPPSLAKVSLLAFDARCLRRGSSLEAPRPFAMSYSPDHDLLLDQIAASLKQRGLHSAALTLLEAGQPLTFIGSQLLWLAQPALALLWPGAPVQPLARLLESPTAVNSLMVRLAQHEGEL